MQYYNNEAVPNERSTSTRSEYRPYESALTDPSDPSSTSQLDEPSLEFLEPVRDETTDEKLSIAGMLGRVESMLDDGRCEEGRRTAGADTVEEGFASLGVLSGGRRDRAYSKSR